MAAKKNVQTFEKRRKEEKRRRKQEEKRERRFYKGNKQTANAEPVAAVAAPEEVTAETDALV